MKVKPLRSDLRKLFKRHNLEKKFVKQKEFLEKDSFYPSLHTEELRPKHLNIYFFRIDRKWRAIFILIDKKTVEVVDINLHYG